MNTYPSYLGVVNNGHFQSILPAAPFPAALRFTSIGMQAAQPPESAELDLSAYEGEIILIEGHDGGGWVYSAEIVDHHGGPIAAWLAKHLLSKTD